VDAAAPAQNVRARAPLRHTIRTNAALNAPHGLSDTSHASSDMAGGTMGCSPGGSTASRAGRRNSATNDRLVTPASRTGSELNAEICGASAASSSTEAVPEIIGSPPLLLSAASWARVMMVMS